LRNQDKMSNYFSGPIGDVTVYKYGMVDQEVEEDFRNTLEVYSHWVDELVGNHTSILLRESILISDQTSKLGEDKQVDLSPYLKESLGLSDNIGIKQTVIIELSEKLGLNDAFILPTGNLTIGESQISPLISPTKQNYLITETPEFEFEFYNETTAMIKDKEDIENAIP